MTHHVEDRILESSISTGAGNMALAGAITGFRRFSAAYAVGDTFPYFIEAIDSLGQPTGDYEYGIGTYSAANTLTRTTVEGSSNGGAAVNFAAGSKNVGVSLNASGFNRSASGGTDIIKLPDGTMIQTGTGATGDGGALVTVNFPTAFVGTTPKVVANQNTTSAGGLTFYSGNVSLAAFQAAASTGPIGFTWIAIGRWK